MTAHWAKDAIFYHVYPLGSSGAPHRNDFTTPPVGRLAQLYDWIGHWQAMGINALYLGPVFESSAHGYDTADYFRVDRRLGDNALLAALVKRLHEKGIRVILDGVFNHVGRDFRAFQDVLQHGAQSAYCAWFSGLRFDRRSPYGDPFTYDTWDGNYDLVKLNLAHPDVRQHLFAAVETWIRAFDIDGLRLDAADVMDPVFLQDLARFCRDRRPDFWLVGEVVHGDYRQVANAQSLDATTNYECYKGLYSSHNDRNYFELAHSLQRQFGPNGIYRDLSLYSFADNHDVDRIASRLSHPAHLYPLHLLLFTMPGVPSIYYGSEWGISGVKAQGGDPALRPTILNPESTLRPHPSLVTALSRLTRVRHGADALRHGAYRQLAVQAEQFAFARQTPHQTVVVVVNAADEPSSLVLEVPDLTGRTLTDALDPGTGFRVSDGRVTIDPIPSCWGRILLAS
ncbi:MAG: alpha-glucosidase C-terminal domain-containing protein [Candidatus Sericytochromatia bacterium]|nr:alpha-glucosidase C-terminal domain-containing protein [Candidatus Sericytochromatia bacterium]